MTADDPTHGDPADGSPADGDHADQARDAGRLVGDALEGATEVVGDVHRRVTEQVHPALEAAGVPTEPVQQALEGITGITYASIRAGMKAVPQAAAIAANVIATKDDHGTGADPDPDRSGSGSPSDSARSRAAVAALNGIWGDTLARDYPALAFRLSLRFDRRDLAVTDADLRRAYPGAGDRVVLFVHGLANSEDDWFPGDTAGDQVNLGRQLAADLGVTPLYLRYNSGLHISDNGRDLAGLLESLVREWPVPLRGISLVGHSMGGLVIHSAIAVATGSGHSWTSLVDHVVTLGTPHLGSPVEKGVNLADRLLAAFPESEPIAQVLRGRSPGVKDLRYGAVHESDWAGTDLDELLTDRTGAVTLLPDARYHHVTATMTDSPDHPLGNLLGDSLVRVPSATGPGREGSPGAAADVVHLGGTSHMALLNSPEVYQHLQGWLSESP